MSYIGSTPTTQSFISGTDYFNGTGSQTAFTLSRTVASVNDIEAVVNNVVQRPNDAYTISGTTITFTSAPSSGTSNIYVRYLSTTTQSITPSQNTVSYSTLNTDMQSGGYASNFKNRIINGNMTIDQRNAGASVTIPATITTYTLDRWNAYCAQASKFSVQQNAGAVTPPAGYKYYLGVTSLSSYSSLATDQFIVRQPIEGYNVSDLMFGTANAQSITVSFWVRSSLTGQFGGSLSNDNADYTYPFAYTINSANTWEQKTLNIVGAPGGTWNTTNSRGLQLIFSMGSGSNYAGTAGAWASSYYLTSTGSTSVVGTSGATFYITGVQLEKGSTATSFDYRPYGTEFMLCQRYYQTVGMTNGTQAVGSSASGGNQIYSQRYFLPVTMRTAPSVTYPAIGQSTGNITFLNGGSYPSPAGGTIGDQDVEPGSFSFSVQHTASVWTAMQSPILFATGASEFKLSAEL